MLERSSDGREIGERRRSPGGPLFGAKWLTVGFEGSEEGEPCGCSTRSVFSPAVTPFAYSIAASESIPRLGVVLERIALERRVLRRLRPPTTIAGPMFHVAPGGGLAISVYLTIFPNEALCRGVWGLVIDGCTDSRFEYDEAVRPEQSQRPRAKLKRSSDQRITILQSGCGHKMRGFARVLDKAPSLVCCGRVTNKRSAWPRESGSE